MTILVTGAAGFIGSNVVKALLERMEEVCIVGVDCMDAYYDVRLKQERLKEFNADSRFIFRKGDIADPSFVFGLFEEYHPEYVLNFAAKVGVRHSVSHPEEYISTNITGFYNILEACRRHPVEHLVYASSSSVYGSNAKIPYSTDDKVDNPVSLYAATKKSNELMAHAYSKLYDIPSTGLRFFTVYGPAGRPDMAYFGFTDRLVRGEKIQIFNYGNCKRDFTYIDDIVEGPVTTACLYLRTQCIISETISRRICWMSYGFCRRSSWLPVCCLRTMISRRIRSLCLCSREMCL